MNGRGKFNNVLPRQQVSNMARGLPDPHELTKQLMGQEDIANARMRYVTPSQSAVSSTISLGDSPANSTDSGFLTFGVVADSAYPRLNFTGANSDSFHEGLIQFDFPQIGNSFNIVNAIAFEIYQYFLPQILTDPALHPDYYYDQFIGIQLSELNTESNVFQPINGSGVNFACITDTPSSTSVSAFPLLSRIYFNRPIPNINSLNMRFYRLARNPRLGVFESIRLPKTVVLCIYKPHLVPLDVPVSNRFQVINDSVTEFVSAEGYAADPTYKAGIHLNIQNNTGVIPNSYLAVIEHVNGWYASSFDFVNNTFLVVGLDLSPWTPAVEAGAVITFSCIIMPNRITIVGSFICSSGIKTNGVTVVN